MSPSVRLHRKVISGDRVWRRVHRLHELSRVVVYSSDGRDVDVSPVNTNTERATAPSLSLTEREVSMEQGRESRREGESESRDSEG